MFHSRAAKRTFISLIAASIIDRQTKRTDDHWKFPKTKRTCWFSLKILHYNNETKKLQITSNKKLIESINPFDPMCSDKYWMYYCETLCFENSFRKTLCYQTIHILNIRRTSRLLQTSLDLWWSCSFMILETAVDKTVWPRGQFSTSSCSIQS